MGAPPSREETFSSFPDSDADQQETSRSEQGGGEDPHRPPVPLRQQLMGACRADERLRPLLTLNVSCASADDRFISHLSQHFEVSEVGLLARCLCVPLVSLRVGKVDRHGPLLCPTTIRGKLSLVLLPSSSMRITIAGDDGHSEQLALLNNGFDVSEVRIEEISADISGRSFLIRISESQVFYYWCAEKSKEHGMELLAKMKNLLQGRPMLSELTGISNSRLDAFATHLHAYLLTSSIGDVKSLGSLHDFLSTSSPHDQYLQSPSVVSKSSRFRASAANATKASSVYQASPSPRSGTFKDGVPRTSCANIVGRDKLKRRGEWLSPSTAPVDANPLISESVSPDSTSEKCDGDCSTNILTTAPLALPLSFPLLPSLYPLATQCPLPEGSSEKPFKPYYCWCPPCPSSLQYSVIPLHMPVTSVEPLPLPPLSSLLSNEPPPASAVSSKLDTTDLSSFNLPSILHDPLLHLPLPASPLVPLHGSQVPTFTPLMYPADLPSFNLPSILHDPLLHLPLPASPLVPLHGSQVPTFTPLMYPADLPSFNLPSILHDPLLHLPLPASPLVPLHGSQVPTFTPVMYPADLPSFNLPSILHDPLLHLPLPASPLVPLHGSQVPTFTPLMSDPIVHVPVIDVCSSGQVYLVSCGASISSTVPLLPSLKPLIPETESLVERSARETLMRLIASAPPASNPQLANILPALLVDVPENISRATNVNKNKHVVVHVNDDFFSSSCGVNVIGSGIAAMRSEDEVSSGDDAHATFVEYDYISDDCD